VELHPIVPSPAFIVPKTNLFIPSNSQPTVAIGEHITIVFVTLVVTLLLELLPSSLKLVEV